ncbi:MAG: hypothetical protein M5U12_11195 [Verrucomicrobia bacterium]|nr:hypothetical protein [Verrucomicrobiota bacterium]
MPHFLESDDAEREHHSPTRQRGDARGPLQPTFHAVRLAHRPPGQQQIEVPRGHRRVGAPTGRFGRAQPGQDLVELEKRLPVRPGIQVRRHGRELAAVHPGGRLVQETAERKQVGLNRPGSLGWDKALRAHKGPCLVRRRHQAKIRQLGLSPHEDDIRGFDVAMDQAMTMDVAQRTAQPHAERHDLRHRQAPPGVQLRTQGARAVAHDEGVDLAAG